MATRDFGTDLYVQKGEARGQVISSIDTIRETVRRALGGAMIVDEGGQFSADNYFSATDSRHGLHFTIRGRAENVMVDIAMHMAQFEDPINLVLGKRLTRNYKVTVTRHELMGGRVEQVPERAPARLVTSREVKSEVELVRYGNDVTIDTNLLASPEDFQADLKRKVDFQKAQFQQKLVELGYECLMNESQNLIHALARAIPAPTPRDARDEANRRYFKDCFLAFNFPDVRSAADPVRKRAWDPTNVVGKILSHVRAAATATAAPMSVMLVPAGLDMQGYQRESAATYSVTGIKQNELAPVQFPLSSVMVDPITNLRIGVHYPLMSYDSGTRNPMAQENTGLSQTVYAILRSTQPPASAPGDVPQDTAQDSLVDYTAGTTNENVEAFISRGQALDLADGTSILKMTCSSAIVAAPGPDTGEMLVAYPQTTAHSIEVAPEEMKMQMRAYLGAAIYNDANVIRVPHVHCETARLINKETFLADFGDNQDSIRDEAGRGNVLFLNRAQFTLAMQRMDLAQSNPVVPNARSTVVAGGRGTGPMNPVTSTAGKFAMPTSGKSSSDKSAGLTEGEAALDALVDGGKKKKKGVHRA